LLQNERQESLHTVSYLPDRPDQMQTASKCRTASSQAADFLAERRRSGECVFEQTMAERAPARFSTERIDHKSAASGRI